MTDFYISFLEDIHKSPKTWGEIKKQHPNEWEAIRRESDARHLLSEHPAGKLHLSFEARFKLLDYYELQEARRAAKESSINAEIARIQANSSIKVAKKSNRTAWCAIGISVFAMIVGIIINISLAIYQINSPVALKESTIHALIMGKNESK